MISSGFFIEIKLKMNNYKFLFTCDHSIPQEIIDSKTKISIYYGKKYEEIKKKIVLDTDQRFIKKIKNLDVTIIELIEEDHILENRFLHPDLNYKMGIEHYLNSQVYTAGYPNVDIHKGDKHYSSGIIKQTLNNGYTFFHTCDTKEGSSGGPIINYDKLVIGIHYGSYPEKKVNVGSFIGEIIKELLLEEKNINPLMEEDDKEDEKEKNNINLKEVELGFSMMDKLMNNSGFNNIMSDYMKSLDMGQFFSNVVNNPQIKELNKTLTMIHPEFKGMNTITPEEIEKFKDKDNNIDLKSLYNYNLKKMGCQNLQEIASKYGNILLNSPMYNPLNNIFENEVQNLNEKNEKNLEEIINKNEDKINEDDLKNIYNEVMKEKNNNNIK